jgi:hypothetical protein
MKNNFVPLSLFTTPVLFLIFNRPDTTQKVFDAIKKAKPKQLFVAADGPRENKEGEKEKCEQARKIIEQVDWDCKVKTLFRDKNLGCKVAVSSAIDWFFENVKEGIILEDDCLPDQSFFQFCKKMLEKYRNDTRIMMITGTNYFINNIEIKESYFFSKHFTIWGWATWRRAWKHYDINMDAWGKFKKEDQLKYLTNSFIIKKHFEKTFDLISNNKMDTWDIQWVFTCFFNNGLAIIPRCNLISNIGVEGTHTIGKVTDSHFLKTYSINNQNLTHPKMVFPNKLYDEKLHNLKNKPVVLKALVFDIVIMLFKKIKIYTVLKNIYRSIVK